MDAAPVSRGRTPSERFSVTGCARTAMTPREVAASRMGGQVAVMRLPSGSGCSPAMPGLVTSCGGGPAAKSCPS